MAVLAASTDQPAGASAISSARRSLQNLAAAVQRVIGLSSVGLYGGRQSRLNISVFWREYIPVFVAGAPRISLGPSRSGSVPLLDSAPTSDFAAGRSIEAGGAGFVGS